MGTKVSPKRPPVELAEMVDRLEKIRAARGLNKEDFEDVAGIPTGNYSRWTSPNYDRVSGIRVATVLTMAKRLGISASELLFGPKAETGRTPRQSEPPASSEWPTGSR